jgi:LmbE family N-acetylglucosaminyl deacetylase
MTGKEGMHWIYLSPHLDDIALSCGGLLWEQAQVGEPVSVWTICAGDPPEGPLSAFAEELHDRWETGREATQARRQEDILACQRLGALYRHFSIPDCIYRQGAGSPGQLYTSERAIFGPLHPYEAALVETLSEEITRRLPAQAELVVPLAIGGHVDHRLTRAAAERLAQSGRRLWYYADYPYALSNLEALENLSRAGWLDSPFSVSPAGLAAWQEGVAAHSSQISTFWPNLQTMKGALQAYCQQNKGVHLWRPAD